MIIIKPFQFGDIMNKRHSLGTGKGTPLRGGLVSTNTKRDLYEVGGIPTELCFDQFYAMFRRSGFAKAGIMIPVNKTWESPPSVFDCAQNKEPTELDTPFMRDWAELCKRFDINKILKSIDYKSEVGTYGGCIIIGNEKEGVKSNQPFEVNGVSNLTDLRPVFQSQIKESTIDYDFKKKSFGMPLTYSFQPNQASTGHQAVFANAQLHRSRVFVFSSDADNGSIHGTSKLEAGFNHLLNMFKIEVSSAEAAFKNASQRLHVSVDDSQASFLSEEEEDEFNESVVDFGDGYDNALYTSNMNVKVLESQLSDPTGAFNVALVGFCSSIGVPKTILTGIESGERSSSENRSTFNEMINSRRENEGTALLKGFINHLVSIRALREPTHEIVVVWDDANSSTDMEKLNLSDKACDINKKMFDSGLPPIFEQEEIRLMAGYGKLNDQSDDSDFDDNELTIEKEISE